MFVIGLCLLLLGGFALLMMHVTETIPNRWAAVRREAEPAVFKRWWIFYSGVACLGTLLALTALF